MTKAVAKENQNEESLSPSEMKYLEVLLEKKLYSKLESQCQAILSQSPSNCSIFHILGLSQLAQKKYEQSIESFRNFIKFRGDFADTYINLGVALTAVDKITEAIEAYKSAINLTPQNPMIYHKLAQILQQSGNISEAVTNYQMVVKLQPANLEILRHLGKLLRFLGRQDEAFEIFEKAVELAGPSLEDYQNLGGLLLASGRYEQAIECYQKAQSFFPDDAVLYGSLGAAYIKVGQYQKAVDHTLHALDLNPNLHWLFSNVVKLIRVGAGKIEISSRLMELMIKSMGDMRIDSKIISPISNQILKGRITPDTVKTLSELDLLDQKIFELLIAHLRYELIADLQVEDCLVALRKSLLERYEKKQYSARSQKLLEALAYQADLNEYLWWQTEDEQIKIRELKQKVQTQAETEHPDKKALFLLAAYMPLDRIDELRKWAIQSCDDIKDGSLKTLIHHMIESPENRRMLMDNIESISSVENDVSKKVRLQYEENPYPRWWSLPFDTPRYYTERIRMELLPAKLAKVTTVANPRILIAGCGTGRHALQAACSYQDASVLAVDLSLASLSYAKSKAEEFGIHNVEFKHADILKLEELNEEFDIIECSGVLHHMAEPETGLAVLLKLLKKEGFIKLGLYSEVARRAVVDIRNAINVDDIECTVTGIRKFRRNIRTNYPDVTKALSGFTDIHATSTLRDLLLHVQEHRFTIPMLRDMFERNKLEFLGFKFIDDQYKTMFANNFPDDPECLNLDNWDQFEQEKPNLFRAMYQFWCRKEVKD